MTARVTAVQNNRHVQLLMNFIRAFLFSLLCGLGALPTLIALEETVLLHVPSSQQHGSVDLKVTLSPVEDFQSNKPEAYLTIDFTPAVFGSFDQWYFYSMNLGPDGGTTADGISGVGKATRFDLLKAQNIISDGPSINQQEIIKDGIPVYKPGAVRMQYRLILGPEVQELQARYTFMICSTAGMCLMPIDKKVNISIPAVEGAEKVSLNHSQDKQADWIDISGEKKYSHTAEDEKAGGVGVILEELEWQGQKFLRAHFQPSPLSGKPSHLYSPAIDGLNGGVPTLFSWREDFIDPEVTYWPQPNQMVHDLEVFPDGDVWALLAYPEGEQPNSVYLHYMGCTDMFCHREAKLKVSLDQKVSDVIAKDPAKAPKVTHHDGGIHWVEVKTQSEVEAIIAEEHAKGNSVLLDFTGPSCVNCQRMAKTVFRLPEVVDAWNASVPVELNTDYYPELSRWQNERFKTQARPLYVRLDPDGTEAQWSLFFATDNEEELSKFLLFLSPGGEGNTVSLDGGFWALVQLALLGGLFTLLMPCTYPMIPLTINFFTKQGDGGKATWPLALTYALGIMGSFVALGITVSYVLGATVTDIAGNPWVNLGIALLFLVLGLSLLGVFFLRLPNFLAQYFSGGGSKGGYVGALIMGLTFAVTAFTCTAPIAGLILAQGAVSGTIVQSAVLMAVYSSAIAVPFFVLALVPKLLQALPKAGSWMDDFKHVGGLVEIAAAFKFFVIADVYWNWGIFTRTSTLAAWGLFSFVAVYLLAKGLSRSNNGIMKTMRLGWVLSFFALGIVCWYALYPGLNLGIIESFFPND